MRNLIIVALSCLAGLPCLAKEDRADEIIAKLQKKYDSVNDVTITFTEHVQFGATKIEQSFSGTLCVKKGKKYRVEMEEQTIVTDGQTVWSFNKTTKQLF